MEKLSRCVFYNTRDNWNCDPIIKCFLVYPAIHIHPTIHLSSHSSEAVIIIRCDTGRRAIERLQGHYFIKYLAVPLLLLRPIIIHSLGGQPHSEMCVPVEPPPSKRGGEEATSRLGRKGAWTESIDSDADEIE